jgi:hypothetical protein
MVGLFLSSLVIGLFLTLTLNKIKISLADEGINIKYKPLDYRVVASCSVDSDCVAVVGWCGEWRSINKRYLRFPVQYGLGIGMQCVCGRLDPIKFPQCSNYQPVSACINRECELTRKFTNINQDEMTKEEKPFLK